MKKIFIILFLFLISKLSNAQTAGDNGHWESYSVAYDQFASGGSDTVASISLTKLSRCKQVHAVRQITTEEFLVYVEGDYASDSIDITIDFVNAELTGYRRAGADDLLSGRTFSFEAPYICCGPHSDLKSSGVNVFSNINGLYINATMHVHSAFYGCGNVGTGAEKIWLYISEVPNCSE